MTFDVNYPDNPWSGVDKNQREWYDPILREIFLEQAVYGRYVTNQFNLAGNVNTTAMHITSLLPPHGNFDTLGLRDLWMASSWVDSFQRTINFNRYGGKLSYHKYDDSITYWQKNAVAGLRRIVNQGLGSHMVDVMDMLARNAFLSGAFAVYGDGSGTSFDVLDGTQVLSTELIDQIHLGMSYRNVPYASQQNGVMGNIVCITSPGVIYEIKREADAAGNQAAFVDIMKYADPTRLIRGEVGTYRGVRWVQTPRATLWNAGEVTFTAELKVAVSAGDGALGTVIDGVKTVGQTGATPYVEVNTGEAANFAVNDIVTVHIDQTAAYGITDGVDWNDGTLHNRRVVAVDTGNDRLSFDKPIMLDMDTDLGGTVYGYVTKARHVHSAVFLGGNDGVVMGVNQPPRIHTPGPVDDFESMYRISWDGYFGYEVFEPEVFEVVFIDGTTRVKGPAV